MNILKKRLPLFLFALLFPILSNAQEVGLDQKIDQAFKPISDFFSGIIFFEIMPGTPLVIVLLVLMALFFTIYFGFPNIRYFPTAINVVRGKYDEIEGGHSVGD